jgi:ADP-heptose:LPS heptosyltransferase
MAARFGDTAGVSLVPGVRRIAVVRANGLGDLVFALPALAALRAAYPTARLTLMGTSLHRELFAHRPGPVDEVLLVPRSRGVNGDEGTADDEAGLAAFFADARAARYDLAFQLHGGGRYSNPFVRRLGARISVGMRSPDADALDRQIPYVYLQHEVLRYLEVVGLAGAAPVTLDAELTVTESDRGEADGAVPPDGRPLAVVHPGASEPRRHWPPQRFAAVADALAAQGARVVLVGGPREAAVTARVAAAMSRPPVDAAGRLSLRALVGLLARAGVFVGNDSGPLHLARAVGAATVGIYWCANMINAMPFSRRRHRAHASWRVDCPVCGLDCLRHDCPHHESFVADVDLAPVRDDALDLLAAAQNAKGASTSRSGTVVGSS